MNQPGALAQTRRPSQLDAYARLIPFREILLFTIWRRLAEAKINGNLGICYSLTVGTK